MKKYLFLFFTACSSGGALMTLDNFHEIPLGATQSEVVACAGEPYSICKKDDGTIEYEYIERIKIGYRDAEERRYIIVMKDGVVIHKKVKQSSPLPYSFDSYDMQTTQNQDDKP
ncbi:MAG TPA: hypothetical protein VLE89_01185 [Chlamydiales bacterium]|nr:hypothetical protein [Chlamydiales bacterium]